MSNAVTTRALTVRLQPDLYAAAAALARKHGKSLNALLHDSLAAAVRAAEDQELFEAFERFGQHPDADVTYAHHAQAEVALNSEYNDGR